MGENVLSPHSGGNSNRNRSLFKSQHRTPEQGKSREVARDCGGGGGRVRDAPGTEGSSYMSPSALGLNSAPYPQSFCPVALCHNIIREAMAVSASL